MLCISSITYRSAGAETLIYLTSIDILLRWSKEDTSVLCIDLVAVNINEVFAISYIELTFEKIVQSLVTLFYKDQFFGGNLCIKCQKGQK